MFETLIRLSSNRQSGAVFTWQAESSVMSTSTFSIASTRTVIQETCWTVLRFCWPLGHGETLPIKQKHFYRAVNSAKLEMTKTWKPIVNAFQECKGGGVIKTLQISISFKKTQLFCTTLKRTKMERSQLIARSLPENNLSASLPSIISRRSRKTSASNQLQPSFAIYDWLTRLILTSIFHKAKRSKLLVKPKS